ncbi:hypothetical protein [Gracilibacillus sp. Marseille-QA3620]
MKKAEFLSKKLLSLSIFLSFGIDWISIFEEIILISRFKGEHTRFKGEKIRFMGEQLSVKGEITLFKSEQSFLWAKLFGYGLLYLDMGDIPRVWAPLLGYRRYPPCMGSFTWV